MSCQRSHAWSPWMCRVQSKGIEHNAYSRQELRTLSFYSALEDISFLCNPLFFNPHEISCSMWACFHPSGQLKRLLLPSPDKKKINSRAAPWHSNAKWKGLSSLSCTKDMLESQEKEKMPFFQEWQDDELSKALLQLSQWHMVISQARKHARMCYKWLCKGLWERKYVINVYTTLSQLIHTPASVTPCDSFYIKRNLILDV